MSNVSIIRDMLMINILQHNVVDIKQKKISEDINSALESGVIQSKDLHRRIIFNSLCEGHGPREMLAVIDSLSEEPWFGVNNSVFLHNVSEEIPNHIRHVPWTWYMVNHSSWLDKLLALDIDWKKISYDRWILCLMRRPSDQRSLFLRRLIERFTQDQIRLSYASMIDTPRFDHISGQQIPILLDGPTINDRYHSAQDPRIFSCVINLIVETSCQEKGTNYWISRYASEKTFKCFGWRQLPVWFAAPGHVNDIRSLEFDVFDDIIDHGYDTVLDPSERMAALLDSLGNFLLCHKNTAPEDFYRSIEPRLDKNYQRLLELNSQRLPYWSYVMDRCCDL